MVAVGVPVSRYSMTGLSAVLIHGSASIREGLGLLEARVPRDEATLAAAATALDRLLRVGHTPIAKIQPPLAAWVLVRVGLAKPATAHAETLTATIKARERVSGVSPA